MKRYLVPIVKTRNTVTRYKVIQNEEKEIPKGGFGKRNPNYLIENMASLEQLAEKYHFKNVDGCLIAPNGKAAYQFKREIINLKAVTAIAEKESENMKIKKETFERYELRKNSIEIRWKNRNVIRPGITSEGQDPEIIKTFDNPEDALAELKKYKTGISVYTDFAGFKYGEIEEYYIEINEYNEDDEWVGGSDIADFSKLEINLVEKRAWNDERTIATFDNMKDAEKALLDAESRAYDEELEYEYDLEF